MSSIEDTEEYSVNCILYSKKAVFIVISTKGTMDLEDAHLLTYPGTTGTTDWILVRYLKGFFMPTVRPTCA